VIWFTSDLHFGHVGVIRYCDRPFATVEKMNEMLVRRWNERVQEHDTIYVLGDMALCPFRDFKPIGERLRGRKILVKGNHDSYSEGQYRSLGFDVYGEIKLRLAGQVCRLSHFPYALPWYKRPFAFKSELRFMDKRPPRIKGEVLLHGHTHTKYRLAEDDDRIHVGVDAWDFYPASLREIESLLSRRRTKT
jgi:calcineurin-like phosphoesterase family protein